MRVVRLGAALAMVSAATAIAAPGAHAATTIRVFAGQSIQAAVDAASPGDTIKIGPGVFHQTVIISKSNLTVIGTGTVIEPPASAVEYGLCVNADPKCEDTNDAPPVSNVTVSGITITGQNVPGFVSGSATNITFANDTATVGGGVGFSIDGTSNSTFTGDTAQGDFAGISLVGDTNVTVTASRFNNNEWGVLTGESNALTLSSSQLESNCAGLVVTLDSGDLAPITVTGNLFAHNNSSCQGNPFLPDADGVGVVVYSGSNVHVTSNAFQANGNPNDPGTYVGGLVVEPTGSNTGNVFKGNSFATNVPLDIRTDDTVPWQNLFAANSCHLSVPAQICS